MVKLDKDLIEEIAGIIIKTSPKWPLNYEKLALVSKQIHKCLFLSLYSYDSILVGRDAQTVLLFSIKDKGVEIRMDKNLFFNWIKNFRTKIEELFLELKRNQNYMIIIDNLQHLTVLKKLQFGFNKDSKWDIINKAATIYSWKISRLIYENRSTLKTLCNCPLEILRYLSGERTYFHSVTFDLVSNIPGFQPNAYDMKELRVPTTKRFVFQTSLFYWSYLHYFAGKLLLRKFV